MELLPTRDCEAGSALVGTNLKVVQLKRGSGGCTPSRDPRGRAPFGGGQWAKPPEGNAFSKMRLEFVHQVDGTMITKLLTKG